MVVVTSTVFDGVDHVVEIGDELEDLRLLSESLTSTFILEYQG